MRRTGIASLPERERRLLASLAGGPRFYLFVAGLMGCSRGALWRTLSSSATDWV